MLSVQAHFLQHVKDFRINGKKTSLNIFCICGVSTKRSLDPSKIAKRFWCVRSCCTRIQNCEWLESNLRNFQAKRQAMQCRLKKASICPIIVDVFVPQINRRLTFSIFILKYAELPPHSHSTVRLSMYCMRCVHCTFDALWDMCLCEWVCLATCKLFGCIFMSTEMSHPYEYA